MGGLFSDRYSPERLLKIGLIGGAVANIVIFFNQNYYVMLGTWIFNAIVQFGVWPSIFKIISSQLVRSERSQMSFYISFSSTAGLLATYAVAAIVPNWRYNFLISAIILIVFVVALHIIEKRLNPYMKWDTNVTVEDIAYRKTGISTIKVFLASGFFLMLFGLVLSYIVSQTRTTLTSIMFVENYETVAPSLGNILTVIMILAGLAGTLVAGRFIKRIKSEVVFIVIISVLKLPFLLACIFVGPLPVSAMLALLSMVAFFEAAMELAKTYYTMCFAKYDLSGTAAGILNAGSSFGFLWRISCRT